MSVTCIGDPDRCARHGVLLVTGQLSNPEHKSCPRCYFVGSCPTHPQSTPWEHPDGMRCSICGYFYNGREPPPPDPVLLRTFEGYREQARRTDGSFDFQYYAGGLCEEAGELWRLVKRSVYHGHRREPDKELDELGDALWLLDGLARKLGYTLAEVATANIVKLRTRYPEGFSQKASRERVT